jgi:signal transduction histidine kinase
MPPTDHERSRGVAAMTLRRRLVLALGSLAATSIVLSFALLLLAVRINATFDDVRRDEQAARDALMLGVAVREQYIHEAHTLIESTHSHLAHHHTWVAQVAASAASLETRVPHAERWRLARVTSASREIDDLFRGALVPAMERGAPEVLAREHQHVDALIARAADDTNAVSLALQARARTAHERATNETRTATRVAALGSVCVLLLAAWHTLRLRTRALRPLTRLLAQTRVIARGGIPKRSARGDMEIREVEDALVRLASDVRAREAQLLAAERMAVLGQMAAGIAHEVNNPIGIIRGYLRTMMPDAKDEEQRRELGILDEEAAACQRIVEDLLTYARSGELRLTDTDIRVLIDETAQRLEASGLTGDVHIDRRIESATLSIDAGRLRQAIENLIRNAVQASAKHGVVEVTGRFVGSEYRIDVQDRGPGIGEADRERIFEPFFSRRAGGSGLGLAVCLGIARAHGGSIVASPREGGGSVLTLVVPASGKKPNS